MRVSKKGVAWPCPYEGPCGWTSYWWELFLWDRLIPFRKRCIRIRIIIRVGRSSVPPARGCARLGSCCCLPRPPLVAAAFGRQVVAAAFGRQVHNTPQLKLPTLQGAGTA